MPKHCDQYRQYWLGKLTPEQFAQHSLHCQQCQTAFALDERIEQEARHIPAPKSAPGLWESIAEDLARDRVDAPSRWSDWRPRLALWLQAGWRPAGKHAAALPVAAVIIVATIVALLVVLPREAPEPSSRTLLTQQALARADALEQQYAQVIDELEALAAPVIASADSELLLRYRDRLETIDAQIRRCQAALQGDPANAHVRRYLMMAYQDKRETLTAVLAYSAKPEGAPPQNPPKRGGQGA